MLIFFIFCTVLFFALFVVMTYISYKSLKLNRNYEEFYNSTLEDILIISESINTIIKNRPLLSDDPDVHRMLKGISIIQDVLTQYGDIRRSGTENKETGQS